MALTDRPRTSISGLTIMTISIVTSTYIQAIYTAPKRLTNDVIFTILT